MELAFVMVLVVCGVALIGYGGLARRPIKTTTDQEPGAASAEALPSEDEDGSDTNA